MPHKPWTTEETLYVIKNYPFKQASEIAVDLDRTLRSITECVTRYNFTGLKNKRWRTNELDLLIKNFTKLTFKELFYLFNGRHSTESIRIKAKRMGLKRRKAK